MERKLLFFGDSWTHGYGVDDYLLHRDHVYGSELTNNLRLCNGFPSVVSTLLDIPYCNFGISGASNGDILNKINEVVGENIDIINSDDIFIVAFSHPYRGYPTGIDYPIDIFNRIDDLLEQYNVFYFNSFYPMFNDVDFIPTDNFIEPDNTFADLLLNYSRNNNIDVWENNNNVFDIRCARFDEFNHHPNRIGYKIIGKYIYDKIKNKI